MWCTVEEGRGGESSLEVLVEGELDRGEGNLIGTKDGGWEALIGELTRFLPSFVPTPSPSSASHDLLLATFSSATEKTGLTSLATVIPKPLPNPLAPSVLHTIFAASRLLPLRPYALVCARVLITSVGTRTRQATSSPDEAASMWIREGGNEGSRRGRVWFLSVS